MYLASKRKREQFAQNLINRPFGTGNRRRLINKAEHREELDVPNTRNHIEDQTESEGPAFLF